MSARTLPRPGGQRAAFLAVVRRDLLPARRGSGAMLARGLAILFCGMAALMAWEEVGQPNLVNEPAEMLSVFLVGLAFVHVTPLAVGALRREREAGMLELVVQAGVLPRTLVAGRITSTFLRLEASLLAILPVLALMWVVRVPSPAQLVAGVLLLSVLHLALAATSVAISASCRSAGLALALSVIVMGAWAGLTLFGLAMGWEESILASLQLVGTTPWTFADLLPFVASNLVIALVATIVAVADVHHGPAPAGDPAWRRAERRAPPADERRPMTWIAQRLSAAARPRYQLPIALIAAAWAFAPGLDRELTVAVGAVVLATGLVAAAALAATSVAPAREKHQWEPLVATAMPTRRLVGDLVLSVLEGTAVPVLTGIALVLAGCLRAELVAPSRLPAIALSIAVAWLFTIVAGLVASVAARAATTALVVAGAITILEPVAGAVVALVWQEASEVPFGDAAGGLGWLLLTFDAAFLGTWLLVRTGAGRRMWSRVLALAPTGAALLLPLLLGGAEGALGWAGALLGLGASGFVLWPAGFRRREPMMMLSGLLLVAAFLVTPAFMMAAADMEAPGLAALGGIGVAAELIAANPEGLAGSQLALWVGVLRQVVIAGGLAAAFGFHADRWLGRAG